MRITAASAPGTDAGLGPHTISIHVEPGMHATNLTPWPLEIVPEPTVLLGLSISLQPGCTSALQHVWQSDARPSSGGLPARASFSSSLQPSLRITGLQTGTCSSGSGGLQVPFTEGLRRTRAMLPVADAHQRLVTYRVVATPSRRHLVVFVDAQPPMTVSNTLAHPLEVHPALCVLKMTVGENAVIFESWQVYPSPLQGSGS